MLVERAKYSDHKKLLAIAKQSKYTTGFSNFIYSGKEMYKKGWIGKAMLGKDLKVVGFICLRHSIRKERTIVYDVGVDINYKRKGVGGALIYWARCSSPYRRIDLNVDDLNIPAIQFYKKLGFEASGVGSWGKGKNSRSYTTYSLEW